MQIMNIILRLIQVLDFKLFSNTIKINVDKGKTYIPYTKAKRKYFV